MSAFDGWGPLLDGEGWLWLGVVLAMGYLVLGACYLVELLVDNRRAEAWARVMAHARDEPACPYCAAEDRCDWPSTR